MLPCPHAPAGMIPGTLLFVYIGSTAANITDAAAGKVKESPLQQVSSLSAFCARACGHAAEHVGVGVGPSLGAHTYTHTRARAHTHTHTHTYTHTHTHKHTHRAGAILDRSCPHNTPHPRRFFSFSLLALHLTFDHATSPPRRSRDAAGLSASYSLGCSLPKLNPKP